MSQQTINIGLAPNDGNGDPLRVAFDKINDNFSELYPNFTVGRILIGDGTNPITTDANFTYDKLTGAFDVKISGIDIISGGLAGISPTGATLRSINGSNVISVSNSGLTFTGDGIFSGTSSLGIGVTPTARLHIAAGTSTIGPLKLTSGTLVSNIAAGIQSGLVEFNGTHLSIVIGSTRYQLDQQTGFPSGAINQVQFNDGAAFAGDPNFLWFPSPSSSLSIFNAAGSVATSITGGQISSTAQLALTTASTNSTITINAGTGLINHNGRATFNPTATLSGLNVGSLAGDPSGPSNADIWYNSSIPALRARINGVTISLGSSNFTNTAANNELMKSDGINGIPSGLGNTTLGNLDLGLSGTSGTQRLVNAVGSASDIDIAITGKGIGAVKMGSVNTYGITSEILQITKRHSSYSAIEDALTIHTGGTAFASILDGFGTQIKIGLAGTTGTVGRTAVMTHQWVTIGSDLSKMRSGVVVGANPGAVTDYYSDGRFYFFNNTTRNFAIGASGGVDSQGDDRFLKTKVINIGDWDMDATIAISVAHGLTLANIRVVHATIRNDSDTVYYPLVRFTDAAGGDGAGIDGVTATNVILERDTGGSFDGVDFDSTGFNRGWITIIYEA